MNNQKRTEELYLAGKMPINIYTLLNGKTAQENYRLIKQDQLQERLNQLSIEEQIELAVLRAIEDLTST